MQDYANTITKFYTAFQQKDYETMASLYHPEATFKDAAFDLKSGKEAGAMWKMLLTAGKDLRIEFSEVKADEKTGSAHWEAWYTFSKTGRKVHNIIEARFEFKDGLIYRHTDHFDFWRWSRQSLGLTGWLLGWSGFLKNKVGASAMKSLQAFMAKSANDA
ncbi:MAG: nuclear transport factor 2 family protein [Phycisphaerae bacterium]|nr:nuclear transport factor 2 family protein [Saprospiraceae bacterium]